MHYFIKVLADSQDHRVLLLLQHPLRLTILMTGALRVWKYPNKSPEGLQQGEFKLSRNEYHMFGLDANQS
jgi:hypothetical protein